MTGKQSPAAELHEAVFRGHPNNLLLGNKSKAFSAGERAVATPLAHILGAPVRGVGGLVGSFLFGRKNRNPLSPMYGTRLHAVRGGKPGVGLGEITKAEYETLRKTPNVPKVFKLKGGPSTLFYQQKYAPGGAVGFIRKHPVISGAGALLAYYLMRNPDKRQAAMAAMQRNPNVDPQVQQDWGNPAGTGNPLGKETWG